MQLCQPHLSRGLSVRAEITVSGESMCANCFAGRPVAIGELAGEPGDAAVREAQRRYYESHRDKVLARIRRGRETRKLALCAAG